MKNKAKTLMELFNSTEMWTKKYYGKLSKKSISGTDSRAFLEENISQYNCFCSLGGVLKVYGDWTKIGSPGDYIVRKLANSIKELFPNRLDSSNYYTPDAIVFHFNDHPETKFRDIKKVVKHAQV